MITRRLGAGLAIAVALVFLPGGVATQNSSIPRLKERMTAAEFERAGLARLTAGELSALESWLATSYPREAPPPPRALASPRPAAAVETVMFNTSNGKYHCASCQWARRCTRNCVSMPLTEARARGVACKVCGGSCR